MSGLTASSRIAIGVVGPARSVGMMNLDEVTQGMKTYLPQYGWSVISSRPTDPQQSTSSKAKTYATILRLAREEGASHCLMIDGSQAGLKSRWLDALIRPGIHSKYDLVTPVYSGGAYDHMLSRTLLHPLLHSLFGQGTRQPLAGEFLLSANLIDRLLEGHDWDSATLCDTPELWINFVAGMEGYRVAESFVGCDDRLRSGARLSWHRGIEQTVSALFHLMERYEAEWVTAPTVRQPDQFGRASIESSDSPKPDGLACLSHFTRAFPAFEAEWRGIFTSLTFDGISELYQRLKRGENAERLGDAAWVRIVYEVAGAWKRRVLPRPHVLGLFVPLYMAHTGSVLMNRRWNEQSDAEGEAQRLANYFQALHPTLRRLWTGK